MQRTRPTLLMLVAALLAAAIALPGAAHAMPVADGGGGAPAAKPKRQKKVKRQRTQPRRSRPQRTVTERKRPRVRPTAPAPRTPAPQPVRTAPQPQPRPAAARPQRRRAAHRRDVGRRANSYLSALDQIEADGGALRTGTARALQEAGPRVRRRAQRIADRRERIAEREAARQRRRRIDRRTVSRGQLYIDARRQANESLGLITTSTARNLSFGSDPRVKHFVERLDGELRERRAERRDRRERRAVRGRAQAYVNALDRIEDNGGALSMGLVHALELADDPQVKGVAGRIQRREARRERRQAVIDRARVVLRTDRPAGDEDPVVRRAIRAIRERRRVRDEGERYANVLDQIEANDGGLNMGLARALTELGDDPAVRRRARRIRKLRDRSHLEEHFGPLDGPTLLDPTLGIPVPWPGHGETIGLSLKAECMRAISPNAVLKCMKSARKPKIRIELSTEASGKIYRGDPRLAPNGREYETLGLRTNLRVAAGLSASSRRRRGIGITLEKFTGDSLTYELMVTSERADDIAGGSEPPNPLDPRSLRRGETIVMSAEDYEGNGQTISYRVLQASLGYEEGRRLSSGVERVGEDRARIYVGDEDFVRNAIELRLGTEDLGIAAGLSREFANGDLKTIDLNLNRRGGWNAYQRFVSTGTLPPPQRRGVRDSADVESASWSSSQSLELDAGPVHVGGSSTPYEGKVTETRHSDGRTDYAWTDRNGRVTFIYGKSKDRRGRVRREGYSLLLQDADEDLGGALLSLHGPGRALDRHQDMRLDYSESDLMAIRQEALEQISRTTQHNDDGLSPAEVEEIVGDDPYAHIPGMLTGPSTRSYLIGLASSRSGWEVLDHIARSSWGDPNRLLDEMYRMQVSPADAEGGDAYSPLAPGLPAPPGDVVVFGD